MSGKRVDIITTWAEAGQVLGLDRRTLKAMFNDYQDSNLPMPIEMRRQRILTTTAALQEWADKRVEMASPKEKN